MKYYRNNDQEIRLKKIKEMICCVIQANLGLNCD